MKLKDKIILAMVLVLFTTGIGITAGRYILKTNDVIYFDLITRHGVSDMAGTGLSGGDEQLEYDSSLLYTQTQVDTLLLDKADTPHDHDDRYYTEDEADVLLDEKLDKGVEDTTTILNLDQARMDTCTIYEVIKMTPLANVPANAEEGWLYWSAEATDSGLFIYHGADWRKITTN